VNSSATKRSSSEKSQIPVPCSPAISHVSCTMADSVGKTTVRRPDVMTPSRTTRPVADIQWEWRTPLANGQRLVTR
jgi:hypothetical protein